MKMDVQRLGDISLKEAVSLVAGRSENAAEEGSQEKHGGFSAPAQLKQAYAVVPAKLRLVTLVAILKRAFSRRGSVMKAIVFISCADSVDFHFEVLTRDEAEKPTTVTVTGKEATEGTTHEEVHSIPPASQKYGKIQQGGTIEEARTNA
ncbi:ATP-dependent RNA helicase dbp7, partial [Cryomyces antarcticus]